jgi:hypothetical protein
MSMMLPDRFSPHDALTAGFTERAPTPAPPVALARPRAPGPVEETALTLPLRGPCRIELATTSGGSGHRGLLIYPLAETSVTVRAPCAGTVIEAVDSFADAGNRLVLRRDDGIYVRLASLRQGSISVRAGDRVALGATLAGGNAGRPILLRCQDRPDAAARGRPFCLAGAAQLGNGGPRWVAAAVPAPGQRLDAADGDADLLAALTLLCPGVARFAVAAGGAAAERFHGNTAPVTTLTSDGHAVRDDAGGTLIGVPGAHAWRARLEGRPGALLRCLALGLAMVPLCRLPGMWWSERVCVPTGGDGLAAWLAPRRSARVIGSFAEAGTDIVVRASLRSADASIPERIEIALAPDHGVVAVRAGFTGGWLRFTRPGFEAALDV